MTVENLHITAHVMKRLKGHGIIPLHFTVRDTLGYFSEQLSNVINECTSRNRYRAKNNFTVVIVDNNVITGYWNSMIRWNKCR